MTLQFGCNALTVVQIPDSIPPPFKGAMIASKGDSPARSSWDRSSRDKVPWPLVGGRKRMRGGSLVI
jgi:hypothetical protein